MSLLTIQNIDMSFGGLKALKELNMRVERGLIHALIGPNGAGKTTVFNIISGILKPDRGAISFDEQRIDNLRPDRIISLGISRTFQNIRLFKSLTVLENVMVGRHCRSRAGLASAFFKLPFKTLPEEKEIRDKAMDLLRFVGLLDQKDYKASNLPYGSQRKLEIARALASDPHLLLLDEPAAGMDSQETEGLASLIQQIRNRDVTILLIEHDMNLVMKISDTVTVLNFGQKIAQGDPVHIQSAPVVIEAYLGIQ